MPARSVFRVLAVCLLFSSPVLVLAQEPHQAQLDWSFRTRVLVTGSSHESEPTGFEVYSTFAIEAGLARGLSRALALELTVRTESREVDRAGDPAERLGSIELLPVNLVLQLRPFRSTSVQPYLTAGVNLTVAWEKSGAVDSMDVAPSLGAAIGLGTDFALSDRVLFNVDLRWNSYTADLTTVGTSFARLRLDPLTLGLGVGFRF